MRRTIPNPVVAVVAQELGDYYYSHSKLETLFMGAGAPGLAPEGNCVMKCRNWLHRTNDDSTVEPMEVLGRVLVELMETGPSVRRERVRAVFARCGLAYSVNGVILFGGQAPQVADLAEALRERDIPAMEREVQRALASQKAIPRLLSRPHPACWSRCSRSFSTRRAPAGPQRRRSKSCGQRSKMRLT